MMSGSLVMLAALKLLPCTQGQLLSFSSWWSEQTGTRASSFRISDDDAGSLMLTNVALQNWLKEGRIHQTLSHVTCQRKLSNGGVTRVTRVLTIPQQFCTLSKSISELNSVALIDSWYYHCH